MKTIDTDSYVFMLDQLIREHETAKGKDLDEFKNDMMIAVGLRKARRALDLMPMVQKVNQKLLDDVMRYVEEHWDGTEESIPCEQA